MHVFTCSVLYLRGASQQAPAVTCLHHCRWVMKWDAQERGAGAVTWVKQMGEAHALARTNNISGARSSAVDAEGMAMAFAPPADAKKGLLRLPLMGWRENSIQVTVSRHPQLEPNTKGHTYKPVQYLHRLSNKLADGFLQLWGIPSKLQRELLSYSHSLRWYLGKNLKREKKDAQCQDSKDKFWKQGLRSFPPEMFKAQFL